MKAKHVCNIFSFVYFKKTSKKNNYFSSYSSWTNFMLYIFWLLSLFLCMYVIYGLTYITLHYRNNSIFFLPTTSSTSMRNNISITEKSLIFPNRKLEFLVHKLHFPYFVSFFYNFIFFSFSIIIFVVGTFKEKQVCCLL